MPWCETCSRFLNPNTINRDGTCPTCLRTMADPDKVAEALDLKTPWHFKLMVVAVVVYLVWRFADMLGWIVAAAGLPSF